MAQLLDRTDAFIRRQPKVSGNYEQILGRSLEGLVTRAEELKRQWQASGGRQSAAGGGGDAALCGHAAQCWGKQAPSCQHWG